MRQGIPKVDGEWVRFVDVKDWRRSEDWQKAREQLKDRIVKEFRRTKYNITFSRIEDFIDEVFGST